jgi:hypothetical protein
VRRNSIGQHMNYRERIVKLCLLLLFSYSCNHAQSDAENKYSNHVGDIALDEQLDEPGYVICYPDFVFQYYNFANGVQFEGEKSKIIEHFQKGFKPIAGCKEYGYVTIRFIVNCKGKTGRFRVSEMNMDYEEIKFNDQLVHQLLDLTRQLQGWKVGIYNNQERDYYQYLTFKIEEGIIKEILP